jgi:hypothetical protein
MGAGMSREECSAGRHRVISLFPASSEPHGIWSAMHATFGRLLRRLGCLAVLSSSLLALVCEISRAEGADFGFYARAADYCRGDVPRPMALSADKKIFCFDGPLERNLDFSVIKGFPEGGLFVVRSEGGYPSVTRPLADYLQSQRATVVVYDYCLSACALYLLLASEQTIVLRNSLVAWHYTDDARYCPDWIEAHDGGPKRFQKVPCRDSSRDFENDDVAFGHADYRFFKSRLVDREFSMPPESVLVRERLRKLIDGSATCPIELAWMWHPRYFAATFKTKVEFEKYPADQQEVDALALKLRLLFGLVMYDP